MARLRFEIYLQHLQRESARFRDVLAGCDPAAAVPSCPDWDAADLLWHLGTVQHFWATILDRRPQGPDDYAEPPRPGRHGEVLEFFDSGSARLVAAMTGADPVEEAWTWSTDHTVGFIVRRQAHEALIHRLDAELAAGRVTPLDAVLAADGVEEALDVMFGGQPPWGEFTPQERYVRVECTDTGDATWVQLGHFRGTGPDGTVHDGADLRVVPARSAPALATVSGPAAALDAWLWHRGDDGEIGVEGDRSAYADFRACVDVPIE
ncbi:maleylpyruvate isomerase family mycothiol-dependent enzyme [Nocardioides sp. W7]|uniref:maleylpyruvate isomerase family mycothiol-dependent enzyme n=1 Tax=Nocardioides sp. W7 TaxID=2931390 RepID=UPI001FD153A3|nr:maleylpyruvate isomerase family mycothiol-dependent enzyme [Nocardioides sp. W7]